MAEGSKVRLVRCPKCENLLQELPNYSVYQCGCCSALLRAKKKLTVIGEGFEKLESLSEKKHEIEKEIDGFCLERRKDRIFKEKNVNFISNSLRIQHKETSTYSNNTQPLKQSESVNSNRGKRIVKTGFDHGGLDQTRFSGFGYHGEGPSSYANRTNRFAQLEPDRAELIWKLDELKEQICRSGSMVDKPRATVARFEPEIAAPGAALPPLPRDKYARRLPYVKHFGDDVGIKKIYVPRNDGVNDFQARMPRVNSYQSPGQFWQKPSHDYLRGEDTDFFEDLTFLPRKKFYHEPVCSRTQFYNKNWQVPWLQNRGPRANYSALCLKDANSRYRCHGKARICHPIGGGAPFIACYSCFELLNLPRKLTAREKNQHKLRCGSCSGVFLLEIKNKRQIISFPAENEEQLPNIGSKKVPLSPEGIKNLTDFDSADYGFKSIDSERNKLPENERLHEPASQSPTFKGSFPEHLDHVKSNREVNQSEQGNAVLDKSTSQENLEIKVSSETEVEVSLNEYSTASLSQESTDISKEDRPRANKGAESFLVSLLKSSFKDFSRSNQHTEDAKLNVSVNGQPIPDHIVKKVEKLAGSIQPGDYWYDYQAGFWGVMGHPCLGIIPPFIEEFNYPMTRNCAAGNTSVFVNGRELHHKDLDVLASRGLPTTKEKFYIIEISGRVYDKDSGKELKKLGKLAPTVEKLKRGFGMKVPRKL